MGPGLQTEIAIMVGILIGAWVLKVAAVAFYMVWSRRRLEILEQQQQQQQERACNCKRIPEHVIQALPVMTYAQLLMQQTPAVSTASATARTTESAGSNGPTTADMCRCPPQQQQSTMRVTTAARAGSLECTPFAAPAQEQQAAASQVRHSLLSRLSPVISGLGQSRSQNLSRVASSSASIHTAASDCDLAQQQSTLSSDRDCCTICFYDYAGSNLVKQLPCRHYYHVDCIDEWLVRDNTCPLCKRSVWSPPSSKQQSATDPSAAQTGAAASEDPAQADEPSATLSPSDAASAPNSALVTATSAAEVAIVIVPAAAAEEAEEEKEAEAEAGAAAAGGVAGPSPSQSATAGSAGQLVPPSMQQQQSAAQVNQGQQQSLEVVVV